MTKQEAIDDSVNKAEKYLTDNFLNDAQAARIGRNLWANLRQAERDSKIEAPQDRGGTSWDQEWQERGNDHP